MKKIKKVLKWVGVVVLVLALAGGFLFFKYLFPFIQKMKETQLVQFDNNLTLVIGGGGNSGIFNSSNLVVVIDTKMDAAADSLYSLVKQIAGTKPILVINTHIHPDHCKGNALYKNCRIMAGANYGKDLWIKDAGEATLPNEWLKDNIRIPMDDDTLTVFNLGKNVHTQSDVMVYSQRRKLLFAGDVILNKQAPVIIGGIADPDGYVSTMDELPLQYDIKGVVPGHGSLAGPEVIAEFKQFFSDMKVAGIEPSKKKELIRKYKTWNQIPLLMSPGAVASYYAKHK